MPVVRERTQISPESWHADFGELISGYLSIDVEISYPGSNSRFSITESEK